MIRKNTLRFLLGLLILSVIGCEKAPNENLTKPNDTLSSTTVVDVKTSQKPEVVSASIGEVDETLGTQRSIRTAPEVVSTSANVDDIRPKMFGTDAYVLNSAEVTGDILTVNVSYRGGCEPHKFTISGQGSFLGPSPVQINLFLIHNANGDLCQEWITEENDFDLTPIKTLYQEVRQEDSGRIILRIINTGEVVEVVYEFSM